MLIPYSNTQGERCYSIDNDIKNKKEIESKFQILQIM